MGRSRGGSSGGGRGGREEGGGGGEEPDSIDAFRESLIGEVGLILLGCTTVDGSMIDAALRVEVKPRPKLRQNRRRSFAN